MIVMQSVIVIYWLVLWAGGWVRVDLVVVVYVVDQVYFDQLNWWFVSYDSVLYELIVEVDM